MGSKKSSSTSTTSTNLTDNSAVAGNNATALAAGASWSNFSASDDDFNAAYQDYSSTTVVSADPGAIALAQQSAELVGAVAESQTDAVRFMTQAGADMVRDMGAAASNLYERAGINNVTSWGQTTGAAERLLSGVADRVGATWADTMDRSASLIGQAASSAASTTNAAIAAYKPAEAQQADTARYALWAVGGLVALVVLPRILKG